MPQPVNKRVLQCLCQIAGLTCDEETPLAVEVEQGLPPLAFPVFNHVGLIQNQVFPFFPPEHLGILCANPLHVILL